MSSFFRVRVWTIFSAHKQLKQQIAATPSLVLHQPPVFPLYNLLISAAATVSWFQFSWLNPKKDTTHLFRFRSRARQSIVWMKLWYATDQKELRVHVCTSSTSRIGMDDYQQQRQTSLSLQGIHLPMSRSGGETGEIEARTRLTSSIHQLTGFN